MDAPSRCSLGLHEHVAKRNILSCNKLPVVVTDLRKLVTKAGIWSDAASVGVVSDVIE